VAYSRSGNGSEVKAFYKLWCRQYLRTVSLTR